MSRLCNKLGGGRAPDVLIEGASGSPATGRLDARSVCKVETWASHGTHRMLLPPGASGLRVLRLYGRRRSAATRRGRELLERFDLSEPADRPVKGYSGGLRRRLDLAAALLATPPILYLDEPTTGLDPRSRLDLWEVIEQLVQ